MGSISILLDECKQGEEQALAKLCARYWVYFVETARGRLRSRPLRTADAEDVVVSAMLTFWQRAKNGQLAGLETCDQLQAWLATVIANKVVDRYRQERTEKSGGKQSPVALFAAAAVADDELSPADRELLSDNYEHYVNGLPDELRPLAELHLAGFTYEEIAARLGCVRRTVVRRIKVIREIWAEMANLAGDL